jgi:hypothetical protein
VPSKRQPATIKVTQRNLKDYKFDPENANLGTERGQRLIEQSVAELGPGRSVLVDSDDTLIAGEHATKAALAAGIEKAIEIEVPPDAFVVVKRSDLHTGDEKRKRLALADNRAQAVNLNFDADMLLSDMPALDGFWREDEIDALMEQKGIADLVADNLDTEKEGDRLTGNRKKQIKPVLYVDEVRLFEEAMAATGLMNRGQALLEICRVYLEGKQQ